MIFLFRSNQYLILNVLYVKKINFMKKGKINLKIKVKKVCFFINSRWNTINKIIFRWLVTIKLAQINSFEQSIQQNQIFWFVRKDIGFCDIYIFCINNLQSIINDKIQINKVLMISNKSYLKFDSPCWFTYFP